MRKFWTWLCCLAFRKATAGCPSSARYQFVICLQKKRFATLSACLDSIEEQQSLTKKKKKIKLLHAYKCEYCGDWHKTSKVMTFDA